MHFNFILSMLVLHTKDMKFLKCLRKKSGFTVLPQSCMQLFHRVRAIVLACACMNMQKCGAESSEQAMRENKNALSLYM